MNTEIILVFSILLITVIFFAFEVFPVDKIAIFIIVSLILTGLVSPQEAISGFSNAATIAILALMILAIAMEENGVINWLTSGMSRVRTFPIYLIAPVFMLVAAGISAFISTTAVVIVFIKIINQLSEKYNLSATKLLLPISFAGILGGSCTLMGTSTNLIVNSVAQNLGAQKLGFFDFTAYGLIFLGISILYLTVAIKWLPWGKTKKFTEDYKISNYITNVTIPKNSKLINKTIEESFVFESQAITILKLIRNNDVINAPRKYITLHANDELLVTCDFKTLTALAASKHLKIHKEQVVEEEEDKKIDVTSVVANSDDIVFVELLMLPNSFLLGKNIEELQYVMLQDAVPIAIKKRKSLIKITELLKRIGKERIVLETGDRLLVEINRDNLSLLDNYENIIILQQFEPKDTVIPYKKYFSLFVLTGVVAMAVSGMLSVLVSALTGVAVLLLTNNLDLNNVYKKINWQIIFLLAGMIPLGVAMHNSGADMWLSNVLMTVLNGRSNLIIMGLLFLITMLMSGIISNNATAIIMTPIAISVAQGLKLDYQPFILAVLFASNFSFFTPVGYQTNTLVYGIGDYRFRHFFFIGGILSVILWLLATFLLTKQL
ncbi:MAG: SLC13 family permease [Flavobacteriales bacterium]|nr:MAG: SLC13 family permease [Flavobacteriales bacterium]